MTCASALSRDRKPLADVGRSFVCTDRLRSERRGSLWDEVCCRVMIINFITTNLRANTDLELIETTDNRVTVNEGSK